MDFAAHPNPAINRTLGNVMDSNNKVWNIHEPSVWDEKHEILEWLSPLAPRERHRVVREGRVKGVADWLLQTNEFKEWHASEDQAVHPLLFCYGDPGAGKTYLSSLVIDTLCDSVGGDNVAVACVYCDFRAHKEQSATSVLAALLKQLVAGVESVPQEITEAFERVKGAVGGRALRLPEVCAMLVKSLSSLRRGFICIDALDEFPTKHRPELWKSLQHIARECPNTRLFITGRPHTREEVRKYFPGYPDLTPIGPTKEDIQEYITMRLAEDPELDAMDAELEADILRIIPDKISEAFRLVSLIVDAVLEDATIHERRQTLHQMTSGFGLDDAYGTTLDRIREQRGVKAKLGMEALMWISRSKRPLKAEELCHALAVEVGTTDLDIDNVPSIRTLLSCTLGIVTIDEQTSTVRFVHFTLHEYLAAHPNLFTTPHSMMAEICLTYLNFRSVCDISTLDSIPPTAPFLHYASCNWGFHTRKGMTEGVKHLALRLLQRDANHISVDILLHELDFELPSMWNGHDNRHPDFRGFTGLHCIAYMGITEIAIDMVDMKRWDINGCDFNGATPLAWAARYGNYALAKLLLEQENVNPALTDKQGLAPLTHAAKAGQEGVVKLLLERGDVNPNSSDGCYRTPLSYAAESGHGDLVKILLERAYVNPDLADEYGLTPISYAARSGHEGVVKMFLERRDTNPDLPDRYYRTPLSYAAESGCEGAVKELLERVDVNPDRSDEDGRTPLSYAAESGSEGVVKKLLERVDANPNRSDENGRTPLSYAAESGHEEVVKILLERRDVNPDSPDLSGLTPLSHAAGSGHEGVVKMFLERRDFNPDSPDRYYRTPLSYAAESGREGAVKELLERVDVNPDRSDEDGHTPLSYAMESGSEGVVKILLERRDVDPNFSDNDGRTPLSYADESRHEGIAEILLERAGFSAPRFFSHRKLPNLGVAQQTSVFATSAQDEPEPGLVSQREVITSNIRQEITEVIPLSPSEPSSNQLERPPSVSVPQPMSTSGTAPDPAVLQPSGPLKRYLPTTRPPSRPSKRKRLPSSQHPR